MTKLQKTKAFTLIELLVVFTIVGLMLTLVPPMMSNVIANSQVKSATRYLAAGLKSARNQAIVTRREMTLTLNVEDNSYVVGNKNRKLDLPDDSKLILTTAKSEQLDENIGAIRFFTDGSSTGGQIKLDYRKFEYIVDVNWLTGSVTISP